MLGASSNTTGAQWNIWVELFFINALGRDSEFNVLSRSEGQRIIVALCLAD